MFLMLVDFKRTNLRHILFCGEAGVTAIGKHDYADDKQNDSQDARWLHNKKMRRMNRLKRSSTLDQVDDQNHHCDHEQDVDEATQRVGTDHSQKPEHE
jgi:hypothetical protein